MMIQTRIVTPHGVYKETQAGIINLESVDGQMGILPEHMPIVTVLKIGKMSMEEQDGRKEYAVAGGLFYYHDNEAEILTDAIESKEEIDAERAASAKDRAEKRLQSSNPNIDQARAEAALKRAMNRLEVKNQK